MTNADSLIANVVSRLRTGYADEIAREHMAGQLEQARALIRENVPRAPEVVRLALVGRNDTLK